MKKSPPNKSGRFERLTLAAARWVTARGRIIVWGAGVLVPLFLLSALLDPHRQDRHQKEEAALLAAKVRSEAALAAMPAPTTRNGVTEITFKALEFIPLADPKNPQTGLAAFAPQAPSRVTAFDQTRVRISGYVLPTRYEAGRVRDFLILSNQMMCCYGSPPRFCDYIVAHAESGPIASMMDLPTAFEETLHVHDVYVNGSWSALYSMDCTKITQ